MSFHKTLPSISFSIITVVKNGERYLEDAIKSVAQQSYKPIEYIIIDGASTDGTVDIIRQYSGEIDYWESTPDNGLYDAMNKGIQRARGEVLGILNSDDWYEPEIIRQIASEFQDDPELGIVHGRLGLYTDQGVFSGETVHSDYPVYRYFSTPFKHPTCFVRKSVYERIGVFNERYKRAADFDFMLRAVKAGVKRKYLDVRISNLRQVGLTSGEEGVSAQDELLEIYRGSTGSRFLAHLILFTRIAYKRLRKIGR